jgi:hypothetical protein
MGKYNFYLVKYYQNLSLHIQDLKLHVLVIVVLQADLEIYICL